MKTSKLGFILLLAATGAACGAAPIRLDHSVPLYELRNAASASSDPEIVGRWALDEMLAPGGDSKQAANARDRLAKLGSSGLYSHFASAVYDEAHGRPQEAAQAFVQTLRVAAEDSRPEVSLISWYAADHLVALRHSVAKLYEREKSKIEPLVTAPKNLGWRAVSKLLEWWAIETFDQVAATGDAYDALVTRKMGCATSLRIAGPFGHGSQADTRRHFPAEAARPWPIAWEKDPIRGTTPHVLKTEANRCQVVSTEQGESGVFYVETYVTTDKPRDLLLSVQAAVQIWINDSSVLERSLSNWGSWQKFGAAVHVEPGRHRILARTTMPATTLRLLNLDGTAAQVSTDTRADIPYSAIAAQSLSDPNPLGSIVHRQTARSPLEAFVGSYVAHTDGMDDVANVLLEPYTKPRDAGALMLLTASTYVGGDPAYADDVKQRMAADFRKRAAERDAKLWKARALLIVDDAERRGMIEAVEPLRALVKEFPLVPEVAVELARVYGRLGWEAERMRALTDLAEKFPDDADALRIYLDALEKNGPLAKADEVARRIKKLDVDSSVDIERAIARQDWKTALAELTRLSKRRPDRKDIANHIAEVMLRAGDTRAAIQQLERAIKKQPLDAAARFRLADLAFARGDEAALRKSLADALEVGANGAALRNAIDLVEGATDLEPYRIDSRNVIREFEAWMRAGNKMEGNAARVLDYAANWVHADGSSDMLEHEVQRIQSHEAISKESEIAPPEGRVLRMRVIKPDGSILEPEQVAGKPTLTFPHLEIGDYLETEQILSQPGDGQHGKRYRGPHWFFREADKGYWRSEFIVIVPKNKPVQIEKRGQVGDPKKRDIGSFVEHRFRVDQSPPVTVEPESPPPTEFYPSVRVGWGVSLESTLVRLVDMATDETPLDPRIRKTALDIVRGVPESDTDERARRLYRFVVENIQDGNENDARRALTGLVGSKQYAFLYLLRLIGIPTELAIAKNRLAPAPLGPMSEVENFDNLVVRLQTNKGVRWLVVRDKFAPYGYVPAEIRGQQAYRLSAGTPSDVVAATGAADSITYEGRADMREDGSAAISLTMTFSGNRAIAWRNVLEQIPEARYKEFLDNEVVTPALGGGHVREVSFENRREVDSPLIARLRVDAPELAKPVAGGLSLRDLFSADLGQLAALPERQTPLLRRHSFRSEIRFDIVMPESIRLPTTLPTGEMREGDSLIRVRDAVHGHAIQLDRLVEFPAMRIQPGAPYQKFRTFVRSAGELLDHDVLLGRAK